MIDLWKKYKQVRALRRLFLCPDGKLNEDAKTVLEWLRDEANAKGRRVNENGTSLLFAPDGRFDAAAVCYAAGQRRLFDLIVSRLSVSEFDVFNLASQTDDETKNKELFDDLTLI